mmetsp:Transcript_27469/g.75084  ORF Transcript_27469/g.75084 Transcript_27469/m.75084 type:complete len:408 (+) Transcript_27469:64-1287(+)
MKLTIPAALLTTSVTASSEVHRSTTKDAVFAGNRDLAVSMEDRFEVTSMLKERRASKRNGKVLRNLQRKLRNSQLSSREEEDVGAAENALDIGLFSRGLQSNFTEEEEEPDNMDSLIELCASEDTDPTFTCTCSNLDVDLYTASLSCVYEKNCLETTEDICGSEVNFCFVETYNLELTGPGTGGTSICYDIISPMEFQYCYGLEYADPDSAVPTGCTLEADGTKCNSCEFLSNEYTNTTCNVFDCSNADDVIGSGMSCDDETLVSRKIEYFLTYDPLPCEGGCNICPLAGDMTLLDNNVTMITGDVYFCWQLNLAAQVGYLTALPGDLCNSLPAIVNEPCGCSDGLTTAPETDSSTTEQTGNAWTDPPIVPPVDSTPSDATSDSSVLHSASALASSALLSAFSWFMM